MQVSPPQDSLSKGGSVWWDIYQPVDYDLTSKFGTEAQFKAMVTTCHTAGVKVYVDTVINHMTGQGSTSYGGVTYGKYSYPAYSAADFHYYPDDCSNSDGLIASGDYTGSATNVQQCELVGLADLDTGSTYVRGTIAAYLNKLLSYGADGFRVDAAKHISPTDLSAIYGQLNTTTSGAAPFLAQEVIYGSGEAVQPSQYTGLGDVLDFQSGRYLLSKFNGNISDLQTFGDTWGGMVSSGSAVTFVANHDTERDGSTLNYKSADYALADYFSLAWTYGVPQVYSAYTWSSTDAGSPTGSTGYVTDTECTSGAWTCTDRATGVTGMVGFHNAVKGTSVANWYSDGSNVIAFSRGSAGWIAINNESAAVTRTFTTGLAAGDLLRRHLRHRQQRQLHRHRRHRELQRHRVRDRPGGRRRGDRRERHRHRLHRDHRRGDLQCHRHDGLGHQRLRRRLGRGAGLLGHRQRGRPVLGLVPGLERDGLAAREHVAGVQVHKEGLLGQRDLGERQQPLLHHGHGRGVPERHLEVAPHTRPPPPHTRPRHSSSSVIARAVPGLPSASL